MNMRFLFVCLIVVSLDGAYFEGSGDSLSLLPADKIVIKLVGEDNSWFVSCQGGSTESLQWQRKTSSEILINISTQPQDRVHSERVHKEGLDLVFRSVEQGDEGEYICVQTQNPSYKVQFDLVVVQPIDYGDTPTTQMVKLNEANHRIACGVTGLPFPSVTWRAKGQNIRNNPEVSHINSKYEVDGTDLIIRNMEREDEGSYLCKAVQNVVGEDGTIKYSDFKDLVINLKIEQSPEWLDDQVGGQFYGYVTGTANLTCQAEAEPPPTFRWLDAENIPVSSGKIVNEDYKSVLMLPVVHHAVFGAYTCIAENIHGKLEKVVMLTEGAKPGTPHINPLKIYPDGLDLYIEEPQAEMFLRIEGFQVEIKEINKSWDQVIFLKNFILDKKNVYNLDGLHHNTFYHVRAKSRNKAGLSDASNIIYLHTTGLNAYPRLGLSSRASSPVSFLVIRTCPAVMLTLIWLISMCTSRQL